MDQINNLQGGHSKPVSHSVPASNLQATHEDADKTELSFEVLVARLQEMPEVRVEAVEKGREFAQDTSYPGNETLRTLAQNLISQQIV